MSTTRTIIEPNSSGGRYWAELWAHRELLGFLAWRDIKVRYRQALLGFTWAIIQPLFQTVLLTFVFSRLAGMPNGQTPYPLLVMVGLLPWQFFSAAFSSSSSSLQANAHLLTKVYFPRMVVPLAAVSVAAVDLAVMTAIALPICIAFGPMPGVRLLAMPLFMITAGVAAIGAGLLTSALSIRYRDLRFVIPFILQLGLFATPVGFRADLLPNWKHLLALNPLTGSVEGFRWCMLGDSFALDPTTQMLSVASSLLLLVAGIWTFRKTEHHLADTL